ncbi:UNVERIFIED_CONTAM: hypothetical protein Sradi_4118800 [Sesamum radiatum]|uniref:Uncharacterized protein n=1 Tax=Sesamum radiatum TaxID=300843 RepID=A0AAW2P2I9_SESRA
MRRLHPDSKKAEKPPVSVYVQKRTMKPPVSQPVVETKDTGRTGQHEEDEVVEVAPGAAHSGGVDKGESGCCV